MLQKHDWQYDLDEYIRKGEPYRSEKSAAWHPAIGLQDVDDLQTSEYLFETAKEYIEGKMNIATAQKKIYNRRLDLYNDKNQDIVIKDPQYRVFLMPNIGQQIIVELQGKLQSIRKFDSLNCKIYNLLGCK